MAARRRGRGGYGGDSSLHSVGIDSSLRAAAQQSSSSTRLEPPSVRQQQPRQQGHHGGLLRNATIKEFLAEYPKEDWPAVVENLVLYGLRGLYSNVHPGHLQQGGLDTLEDLTEQARREVVVMSPPRRAFGREPVDHEEEEEETEDVTEQGEQEGEEEESAPTLVPSSPAASNPEGQQQQQQQQPPVTVRRPRKDALFHYPFVDRDGHVDELLGGRHAAGQAGEGEDGAWLLMIGGAERCFYDLDPREQERRARKVFEEMRRGVGGLQRRDLAFSLRLVGVPLSDRQAQRLLPALYEAGPDAAAMPISLQQWLDILRVLKGCFPPASANHAHAQEPASVATTVGPEQQRQHGRAPWQPSPIDTLGLGAVRGPLSTIAIPSGRSTADGEGGGTTTATGGRIRPERARQEDPNHNRSAFHSSSTETGGGGGTPSSSSSSSSSPSRKSSSSSSIGLRAVAGAEGYEPLPSVRAAAGHGGEDVLEDGSSTPLRIHALNQQRQARTYGTAPSGTTAAAGAAPSPVPPSKPRYLRGVESKIKPQLDLERRRRRRRREQAKEQAQPPAAAKLLEVLAKARGRDQGPPVSTDRAPAPAALASSQASSFSASASSAPGIAQAFLAGPLGGRFRAATRSSGSLSDDGDGVLEDGSSYSSSSSSFSSSG